MELRNLPENLGPHERCAVRRMSIQDELQLNLSLLGTESNRIGQAEEKNCEQMFGTIAVPVGYAGPLSVTFSNGENTNVHLPLATTEGALVASVNRGCKACTQANGVRTSSQLKGISRSICWKTEEPVILQSFLRDNKTNWQDMAERTSNHLSIVSHEIVGVDNFVYLQLHADTGNAMGMNMITIAAEAVGKWVAAKANAELITIAANLDSDKKPSQKTRDEGRGWWVKAEATLPSRVLENTLKSSASAMLDVAVAKLEHGSMLAGSLGNNLHAANIIAALYLATGQDVAHIVEGSLATTSVAPTDDGLEIKVTLPAVLVGTIGGGTTLPAQQQCLELLMKEKTTLRPTQQLAEAIGAGVLAGELSLLAAQASGHLASSHKNLAR